MPNTSDVIAVFDEPVVTDGGAAYVVRVLATETPLGQWEGRIEFTPVAGVEPAVTTDRETTQPNRRDLEYWASGLSRVYLDGALRRALGRDIVVPAPPPTEASIAMAATGTPVLDPFAVFAQSEGILRQELRALSRDHLRTIVSAYALDVSPGPHDDLVEAIVAAVRRRVTGV